MSKSYGAVIFGFARDHADTYYLRKTPPNRENPKAKTWEDTWFSTLWNDIEGAIAYQHKLPILILKEDKIYLNIRGDGIYDENNHEFRVISYSPECDSPQNNASLRGFIDDWIRAVKKRKIRMF